MQYCIKEFLTKLNIKAQNIFFRQWHFYVATSPLRNCFLPPEWKNLQEIRANPYPPRSTLDIKWPILHWYNNKYKVHKFTFFCYLRKMLIFIQDMFYFTIRWDGMTKWVFTSLTMEEVAWFSHPMEEVAWSSNGEVAWLSPRVKCDYWEAAKRNFFLVDNPLRP